MTDLQKAFTTRFLNGRLRHRRGRVVARYEINVQTDPPVIPFRTEPSFDAPLVAAAERLLSGQVIELKGETSGIGGWIKIGVRLQDDADPIPGWIETFYLGALVPETPATVPPVVAGLFAAECARQEVLSGGELAVAADYLIALALIETNLTSFGTLLTGSDAVGPYQITSQEWAAYLATDVPVSEEARFSALSQIQCAAWFSERDSAEFAKAVQPASTADPFIPSFLDMFHCRLIGVAAATEVYTIHKAGAENPAMQDVLSKHFAVADLQTLMANRKRFLGAGQGGPIVSVGAFVNQTAAVLADAMTKAFTLLRQEVPEFIPVLPDRSLGQGWMVTAEAERQFWEQNGISETDPLGAQRVLKYFQEATNNPGGGDTAWCGAFVAWCLKQQGGFAADSIVKDPAWAANWKNWGDVELRQRDWQNIPAGAIVVLGPSGDTSGSGHVAFFHKYIPGSSKIDLLGGNQTNRVKLIPEDRSRVVSIRWLSAADVAPDITDRSPIQGAISGATNYDLIILARTIYGEARGEPQQGAEAVANVVINRLNAGGFGNTIAKVCLKPSQFSCWNLNDANRAKIKDKQPHSGDAAFDRCFNVARKAVIGGLADVTDGATHFYAITSNLPSWVRKSRNPVLTITIGHHAFYSGID
ncbi:cell wall hydrolase [Rhizobium changzhiense]|uniref:cell wall hydrolase n=1 Tax=Rhizobium changzhiense TaxID=2692317 RepID=UPI0031450595